MSFERPSKGVLSFQCDACYDIREMAKADGDPVHDIRLCLKSLLEDGWSMADGGHLCEDCTEIRKSDAEREKAITRFK